MSRLLVKNIPVNANPDSLRTHFASAKHNVAIITDVQVARKRDGTSRRFAFVGFKTDEQARAAKEWFNGTFWGSQKITVEIVQGVKGAPAPRPNKRPRLTGPEHATPSPATTASVKPLSKNAAVNTVSEGKDDALATEFLDVMKPRNKKGPAWADGQNLQTSTSIVLSQKEAPTSKEVEDRDQDDLAQNEAVSDLDWMKSRMTHAIREEKEFEQSDDENEVGNGAQTIDAPANTSEPSEPQDIARQSILSTSRLFVRNLTFSCTTEELEELFGRFGKVEQVHIPLTPAHASKGLAFVSFAQPADAVTAWETLDGTTFQGRLLHIIPGVERRKDPALSGDGKKKSLKEERGEKKKREAGRDFNWGTLYMNSDAVVSSIADRMNIPKADILGATEEGPGSQNPAVKLALAETHVIQETKRYFEDQGVVLASLATRSSPRSRMTILVKNIPYGTTPDTLRGLFEPHGEIARLLIPPSGTLAVVQYIHSEEASEGFRRVAYRRLGNSVIYLEWAPEGLIVESSATGDGQTVVKPVTIHEQESVAEEAYSIRSGSTLFVKNLSFTTTTERLEQVFRNMPSFVFARVQMKPAPPNRKAKTQPEHEKLSLGYGFVGFKDADAASKALKSMQGFVLDGHKLHVTFAGRGADEEEKKDPATRMSKTKTAKMIVKNVPFEATKKDIRDLFGVYGTLKSVRLPKKFDARTRGFAFLEFVSRHEAENAFAALRHTHLLGRHLVLDWAAEGEQDVEALRRKVGVGFGGGGELPGKKRKLEMAIDEGDGEDT